jgi:hypothetical protein
VWNGVFVKGAARDVSRGGVAMPAEIDPAGRPAKTDMRVTPRA